MATTTGFLGKKHADKTRRKIKTTQIVRRLNQCALGEIEITPQSLKAAEILLRKTLPDLQSVTLQGDADNPLVVAEVFRAMIAPTMGVTDDPGADSDDETNDSDTGADAGQ